ncbi:MAG: DUF4160 domain-containing protein [Devosia sp.]|nr:DUF4160 domain-containing protein [Devosia sp.]
MFRGEGVVVRMYRDHNPPHCHISTQDGEAQVSLLDLRVIRGELGRRHHRIAMRWIRENRDALLAEWNRLNG